MSLVPVPFAAAAGAVASLGVAPRDGAGLALELHVAMLAQQRCAGAARSLVLELARHLGFDRVGLALSDGQRLTLVADSAGHVGHALPHDPADPQGAAQPVLGACEEVFDQACTVHWPEATPQVGGPMRATRALAAWAGPSGSAGGVPLVANGQMVGALCVRRLTGTAFDAALLEQLEHLACLAAPVLALMRANERGWWRRALDATKDLWTHGSEPRQRTLRQGLTLCGGALLLALLFPWPAQVGGRARLEGAVQRVLAAPVDGFIQKVHARAGDTVRAGQPLLDLADQDLLLERQRWHSQLAQHLDGLATAQAKADRSQLVALQGKADEAQAQLDLVDERLLRSRLVAPFDGTVVQGDWSQQLGSPVKVGTELLTLAPNDRFRVIVDIDERDVADLSEPNGQQQGSLMLSALPWDTLPLRVLRVAPVARAVEGRNVFEVEAELLHRPGALRAGLQGTARIDTGHASPLFHALRRVLGSVRQTWWEWLG
jgi:Barrel-sandwich domain of CusB or HlyD membrane-fusion/GAF domain